MELLFIVEISTKSWGFSRVCQGAQVWWCLGTFHPVAAWLEQRWIFSSKGKQLSLLDVGLVFRWLCNQDGRDLGGRFGALIFLDAGYSGKAKAKDCMLCWKVWGLFWFYFSRYKFFLLCSGTFFIRKKRCVLIFVPLSCDEKLRLFLCCSTFWESHGLCAYISRWQNRSKYYHIPASILFMERGSDKTTFSSQTALNTQK